MKSYKKEVTVGNADWALILSALRTGGDITLADDLEKKVDTNALEKAFEDFENEVRNDYAMSFEEPNGVILSDVWSHIPALQINEAGEIVPHESQRLIIFRPRRMIIGTFESVDIVNAWWAELTPVEFTWNGRSITSSEAGRKLRKITKKYLL